MKKLIFLTLFIFNIGFGAKYNLDLAKKGCLEEVMSSSEMLLLFTYEEIFEYCNCVGNDIKVYVEPMKINNIEEFLQDPEIERIAKKCIKKIL